jgi:hypothetical protein
MASEEMDASREGEHQSPNETSAQRSHDRNRVARNRRENKDRIMTERLHGVYVAFERDIRVDDAESILNAIRCLRGVVAVESKVASFDDFVATSRIRSEMWQKIHDLFFPKKNP